MTEESIRASEPIDLTENSNILRLKYEKFRYFIFIVFLFQLNYIYVIYHSGN